MEKKNLSTPRPDALCDWEITLKHCFHSENEAYTFALFGKSSKKIETRTAR